MLFPEMVAVPVIITNSRGMSADPIAEHVLAVTLAFFRKLPLAFRSQAARQWAQDEIGAAGNRLIAGARVSRGRARQRSAPRGGASLTLARRAVTGVRRRRTGRCRAA